MRTFLPQLHRLCKKAARQRPHSLNVFIPAERYSTRVRATASVPAAARSTKRSFCKRTTLPSPSRSLKRASNVFHSDEGRSKSRASSEAFLGTYSLLRIIKAGSRSSRTALMKQHHTLRLLFPSRKNRFAATARMHPLPPPPNAPEQEAPIAGGINSFLTITAQGASCLMWQYARAPKRRVRQ